jgi:hypothetical protein
MRAMRFWEGDSMGDQNQDQNQQNRAVTDEDVRYELDRMRAQYGSSPPENKDEGKNDKGGKGKK